MPSPVVRYRTPDGAEFTTHAEAEAHEALSALCDRALAGLRPVPTSAEFANGGGYVAQDLDAVRAAKRALLPLIAAAVRRPDFARLTADEAHPHGLVGRLAECCPAPLARAWARIGRIDARGREWGQAFYALNPEAGKQREVSADA